MDKKITSSILIIFSIILAGCNAQTNSQDEKTAAKSFVQAKEKTKNNTAISQVDKIEIIDFHGNRRCYSCEIVEKFTQKTLDEYFKEELKSGKIVFQSINGEDPQNKSIVQKYQARGSSLFINAIKDGKDNIQEDVKVWRLVGKEESFKQYLKNKINNYLN